MNYFYIGTVGEPLTLPKGSYRISYISDEQLIFQHIPCYIYDKQAEYNAQMILGQVDWFRNEQRSKAIRATLSNVEVHYGEEII